MSNEHLAIQFIFKDGEKTSFLFVPEEKEDLLKAMENRQIFFSKKNLSGIFVNMQEIKFFKIGIPIHEEEEKNPSKKND